MTDFNITFDFSEDFDFDYSGDLDFPDFTHFEKIMVLMTLLVGDYLNDISKAFFDSLIAQLVLGVLMMIAWYIKEKAKKTREEFKKKIEGELELETSIKV